MNKDEAIAYCYLHRDEYIRDSGSIDEGSRGFDCLISILESDTIKPDQLAEYGMKYEDGGVKKDVRGLNGLQQPQGGSPVSGSPKCRGGTSPCGGRCVKFQS